MNANEIQRKPTKGKKLTKAERKESKLRENKEWISNYRSNGIEQKELNPRYSQYYQLQLHPYWNQIKENENFEENESWKAFILTLKNPLPVTLRISQRCPRQLQQAILYWLTKKFPHGSKIYLDDKLVEVTMEAIPWASSSSSSSLPVTYQLSIDNSLLLNQPSLQSVKTFLAKQCQLGWIIRQELVSMIPVLFLQLDYRHRILDCCAAPGSKTEQILSIMEESFRSMQEKDRNQFGYLVANDTDTKRIDDLLTKFQSFPSAHLLIAQMNGEIFSSYFSSLGSIEQFDRILCDVPCSGDGTFRKSPHLWRLFRPRTALQFHVLQRKILSQALLLLKPGGRLVYSTCSLNPIEDEAVVASVLAEFCNKEEEENSGTVQLVDITQDTSHQVLNAGLKYRAGLSTWQSDLDIFLVGEDEQNEVERKETIRRILPLPETISPPEKNYHLERCIRILPSDQNTGGFFVAVLEKTHSITKHKAIRKNRTMNSTSSADATTPSSLVVNPSLTKHYKNSNNLKNDGGGGNRSSSAASSSSLRVMKEIGFNPKHQSSSSSSSHHLSNQNEQPSGMINSPFQLLSDYSPPLASRIEKLLFVNFSQQTDNLPSLQRVYVLVTKQSKQIAGDVIIPVHLVAKSVWEAYREYSAKISFHGIGFHLMNLWFPLESSDHEMMNEKNLRIEWKLNNLSQLFSSMLFCFPRRTIPVTIDLQYLFTQYLDFWKKNSSLHHEKDTKKDEKAKESSTNDSHNAQEGMIAKPISFSFILPNLPLSPAEMMIMIAQQDSSCCSLYFNNHEHSEKKGCLAASTSQTSKLSLFELWRHEKTKSALALPKSKEPAARLDARFLQPFIEFLQTQVQSQHVSITSDDEREYIIEVCSSSIEAVAIIEQHGGKEQEQEEENERNISSKQIVSSSNAALSSQLGKRRLSKAERKALMKKQQRLENDSSVKGTQTAEQEDLEEEIARGGGEKGIRKRKLHHRSNHFDSFASCVSLHYHVKVEREGNNGDDHRITCTLLSNEEECEGYLSLLLASSL